jgi:hypothetical protein
MVGAAYNFKLIDGAAGLEKPGSVQGDFSATC